MNKVLLTLLMLTPLSSAVADEFFGLWGGGVNVRDGLYDERSASVQVAPFIFGGYGDLSIEANRASYPLYRDGTWFASAVGHYRSFMALSEDDADELGVDARDPAIEAGLSLGRRLGGGYVTRVSLLQDISSVHEGQEVDWQVFRHDDIGEARLLSALGLQVQSADLSDYYFSTDDYDPGSSFSVELELIASWSQGRVGYFVGTRSYLFSEEVSDSPLVDRPELIQLFAGAGYQF